MCAMDVTLEVGDERYPGRLNVPNEETDRGVLLVPGAGHGPFGDVFLRFSRTAAEAGYHVARFETWPFPADLEEKTDAEFEAELEAAVDFLRDRGCETIAVVAKSFGGRIALQHLPDTVDRLVLWAPAVLAGEHDDEPSISEAELAAITIPVRLLQGDEDRGLSVEDAAQIVEGLPRGELVELPGEDHSFRRDHERVIEETMAFLPD
ncbi:alpha/beta hydrolase [Halovivax limisalsi]|uniref:alpha/beta hydrolase n=1 Tax=Halovivax limisalsi TaxID=1453760 RepID=UPI001FFC2EC8|nr:alpha/beta family hydrolase [Halovivax limisalsi]